MDGTVSSGSYASNDPRARAQSVAGLLRQSTRRIELDRELPKDVLAALHEARMFRLLLPRDRREFRP